MSNDNNNTTNPTAGTVTISDLTPYRPIADKVAANVKKNQGR